jgi:predicted nucleic acid-binding protein
LRRIASGPPPIHAGEREVLALALGREATAVMDDRRGRLRGKRLGVPL